MKAYWGGGIAPRILDLGTIWRWVVSFTPRVLYPQGKSSWYPLDRRLGGPQTRSGRGGEEKNSQTLPALEPPIIQPVAQAYTTELSRLKAIGDDNNSDYNIGRGCSVQSAGGNIWNEGRRSNRGMEKIS
jgi:hypothetical protein